MSSRFRFGRLNPVWLLIFVLLLIGCSNNAAPIETPSLNEEGITPEATDSAFPELEATSPPEINLYMTVEPSDLAGITVRFAHPWLGEGAVTIEKIAANFSRNNPWGITVLAEKHGGEAALIEAVAMDIKAGATPGLIAAHPYQLSFLSNDYSSAVLTDYFNHPEWGFDAEAQMDLTPVFLDQFTLNGDIMALPFAPQATVLFYNQTWAEELGYGAAPADEREFRQQSCAAQFVNWRDGNTESDGTGGWVISLDPKVLSSWYTAFDGSLPVGGTPAFNNDAGRSSFGFLKSLFDEGCIWFPRQPDPYAYFANRYALMYAGTLDQIPAQMGWMDAIGNEDDWTVMGFRGSVGEAVMVDGPGLLVTAETPDNQMAAWLFGRHLLEPDVQAQIVQSLFTLPVRVSAMVLLGEFEESYPQWSQGASLIGVAEPAPVSDGWGIGRWLLQDAANRIFQSNVGETAVILEELDAMIREFEEGVP